jgi:AcrR family transcriptional regulator
MPGVTVTADAPKRRGRPRLASIEDRRATIIRAATGAFARDGVDGASIESIAAAAQVTKPSLYEIFPSKDALYEAAVGIEVDRLAAMVSRAYEQTPTASLQDRTRDRVAAVFAYANESPDGVRLLLAVENGQRSEALGRRMEGVRSAVIEGLAEVMRRDFARAGIEAGPSLDILAAVAVELTLTAAERCLSEGKTDPDAVVTMITAFLTGAFAAMTPDLLAAADRDVKRETA